MAKSIRSTEHVGFFNFIHFLIGCGFSHNDDDDCMNGHFICKYHVIYYLQFSPLIVMRKVYMYAHASMANLVSCHNKLHESELLKQLGFIFYSAVSYLH